MLTFNVAASFAPALCVGVNRSTIVQLDPLASTKPFEQVPDEVFTKSAEFAPLMLKYGLPNVKLPVPVHAGILDVEQLLTDTASAADVVEVPCLPNANVGGCAQLALLPVCPLFGHRIAVALPLPLEEIMLMLRLAVALCTGEVESVTFTVNDEVPAAVGVPLICPELPRVSPAGRVPELTDQLYGVVPPLAASEAA